MEDTAPPPDWRERLRDELLPYAAFYALGLKWLSVAGTVGAWQPVWGFALLALTATFGIPVTALVSLMMIWRAAMLGIDAGRVAPMVAAVSSAIALLIAAFGAVFPMLALGHWVGEHQRAILAPPLVNRPPPAGAGTLDEPPLPGSKRRLALSRLVRPGAWRQARCRGSSTATTRRPLQGSRR